MLNELEKDALKEFINIGFGQAAAELSDIINIQIELTVPDMELLSPDEVREYIRTEMGVEDFSIIQQFFMGNFKGAAFLLLPLAGGRSLLNLFGSYNEEIVSSYGMDALEKETMLEISNILIGACISRVADVLKESVTYSPPVFFRVRSEPFLPEDLLNKDCLIITIKTLLKFRELDIEGYMFILSDVRTTDWIQDSIRKYMEPYK